MVCVVTSEVHAPRSLQLFSQATGDIALDSCVDFWDGSTLRVLSSSDRKKVLDFYQRTSLTAYCTAFAYRPLSRGLNHALTSVYMELPPDSHHLYLRSRSPTPLIWPHPNLSQSIDSLFSGDVFEEEVSDIEGCFETQCNQIFLGMVTMQYQAQIEMVQLIEQLEGACIRFVHFSKENELRSRVFSEKMGLESGWNCHVSLLSNGSLEGTKTMSVSAPSAINTETVRPRIEVNSKDCTDSNSQHDGWQSLSCLTDSTEQSAHINFDMSNRAKLPRGIEQIRPHLENVDNVPLLVSLFTDCTPATTRQMIAIMQDYGEVVCVIGSSANADNCGVFLKADASVSMEPLYPQVCQKVPVYTCPPDTTSPVQLSQRLNSLPCSVEITRLQPVSLFHLIMHARHYMQCIWNCIQFWVCCSLTLSALQVVAAIVMLPPLFSTGQVLWLSCGVVPALAVSLIFAPTNLQVMQRPASKNQFTINSEMAIFALWCYGCKLLPILLVVPLVYGATLASHCRGILASSGTPANTTTVVDCSVVYPKLGDHGGSAAWQPWGGWQHYYRPLFNAQLCIVSASFVHREYLTWLRSPFKNRLWLLVCTSLLIIQSVYTILVVFLGGTEGDYTLPTPWIGIGVACASLPAIYIANEFFKWQEIKYV
ncbi:hypothetical protein AAG570_005715 [Ranatra chinensis]|uniref:Cation-transporting P-type ATPase C-terminal domain-containing protein n=1 Tax=Ranatra chinensis TaxID=642074 RepID=A0ABD0XZX0_9HEMI